MIHWHVKTLGSSGRPSILFLHGFLGSHEDWLPICEHLSGEYHCVLPDLPGHGKTVASRQSDFGMSVTAGSLIRYLDDHDIRKSHLVGYSMGGRLALYLAVHFERYFMTVTLESVSPGLAEKSEKLKRVELDEERAREIRNLSTERFLKKWYSAPLFKSLREHPDFEHLIEQRLKTKNKDWSKSLQGMGLGKQPSLWNRLKFLSTPILILAGEKDEKFRKIAFQMREIHPDFRVSVVKGCGHNIHFEKRDQFLQEINQFLNSVQEGFHE
jgi:2-succinyl-6-hydroxy-2,4-cyclohexadiene-1-carboxylate synthase